MEAMAKLTEALKALIVSAENSAWSCNTSLMDEAIDNAKDALSTALAVEAGAGLSVDALAQEIRRVDGNHSLGAGALAEALMPFLAALTTSPEKG